MRLLILFSSLIAAFGFCLASHPRANTPLGIIEGFFNTSYAGRRYAAFQGVPYAKPPVGSLRFEVPQPTSSWPGVLMAKEFGSACMQFDFSLEDPAYKLSGAEDCLYLNIYAPAVDDYGSTEANVTCSDLHPVVIFIHGGGFVIGSGSIYGPRYLLDRDVVLVTLNYRLGPLGFLSTEDDVVPGNMGLKDQVMAIRWVNENIESFCGDPSRITLFGQSVGGASVHYHYLTNLTAGLFQRGMSISGTALNLWTRGPNALEKAQILASVVGCPAGNGSNTMVECLKDRPAHEIVDALSNFTIVPKSVPYGFGFTPEKHVCESTFMDEWPSQAIAHGHVHDLPWITGVVSNESLYPLAAYVAEETLFTELDEQWDDLAPFVFYYNDTIPKSQHTEIAESIREHYLGNKSISVGTLKETVMMFGDPSYKYFLEKSTRAMAEVMDSPVHVYYFSYRGAHSYSEILSGTTDNLGVCHVDDMGFSLDTPFIDTVSTAEDVEMHNVMLDLWESFASNGTPNVGVEWSSLNKSATNSDFTYLHIAGPENIAAESSSNFGNRDFWDGIDLEGNTKV